jgi:hypothetical protein
MKPHIKVYYRPPIPTNAGYTLASYYAAYFDEKRNKFVPGDEHPTRVTALEDLYGRLEQLGYDRSDLPEPEDCH